MVRRLRHRRRRFLLVLVVASTAPAPASLANVVGADVQNFNPTTDGLDFVTVQSSQTLDCCIVNLGTFVNYAKDGLPLLGQPNQSAPTGRSHDSVTGGDINIGIGLLHNWDIGLSLPQILAQKINDNAPHGEFARTGNTEVRVNTKVKVWGESSYGVALIGSMNFNRVQNDPYAGTGAGPTTNAEVAGDMTVNGVRMALNLGYRFRQPGKQLTQFPIEPFRDQYIESVAASYLLSAIDTKMIGEIYASQPAEHVSQNTDQNASTAEALLGFKYDLTSNLAVHIGGATRLGNGTSSPDWRAYLGVNLAFGPLCGHEGIEHLPKEEIMTAESDVGAVESSEYARAHEPPVETIVLHDIKFGFNSDEVEPGSKETLDQLVAYLLKEPKYKTLTVEGHTDSLGPAAYNVKLSERRANKVRSLLIENYQLAPDSIKAIGYGAAHPIADNGNYQGRQRNRRVEFKIER